MPDFRLVPECHADTTLVRLPTNNDKHIIHASGYPDIGVIIRKSPSNATLIGFVDDDKRIPPYFDDFEIIDPEDKVIFKKKAGSDRYLIEAQKAIETFTIWNAHQAKVGMRKYGFSTDF